MENEKQIVLFDGVCNLCNGAVQFIIEKDNKDVFRFAALQSEIGESLLRERNIDVDNIDSIILIDPGTAFYIKSDAALMIGKNLKGLKIISSILYYIPGSLRDIVYDFVARNRYNWYGKKSECMIPTPSLKAKFL